MRKRHWWAWLIVAGYIWLIFRNSMMIAEASEQMSLGVTGKVMEYLKHFGLYWADPYVLNRYIRKLAHFAEFSGLGFLVGWAIHLCPLFKYRFLNFVLFLFTIPVSDELIQHFYEGRSTQVTDMFIDGAGILFGGFVIYVLILIFNDLFRKR